MFWLNISSIFLCSKCYDELNFKKHFFPFNNIDPSIHQNGELKILFHWILFKNFCVWDFNGQNKQTVRLHFFGEEIEEGGVLRYKFWKGKKKKNW